MHGWQSESTDRPTGRQVVGVVLFGVLAVVTSPTTAGRSVVYCSIVVVVIIVVWCGCGVL